MEGGTNVSFQFQPGSALSLVSGFQGFRVWGLGCYGASRSGVSRFRVSGLTV